MYNPISSKKCAKMKNQHRQSNTSIPAESNIGPLRRQIGQSFNLDEIRFLCSDLNIDFEEVAGETKSAKIQSLIELVQRNGRMQNLLAVLEIERPRLNWHEPAILSSRQMRNRYNFLQNITATWIEGFLHQSLAHSIAIELNLTYKPDAVVRKTLKVSGKEEEFIEHTIRELFEAYGRSLLILGDPGSGKTITLLQLAEDLIQDAQANPIEPIPVILNLSSWSDKRGSLIDWLVEEIFIQYQVSRELSLSWIDNNQLLFLLDGLDEVAEDARIACITAINAFKGQFQTELVVCSRLSDYEKLNNRLNLATAVKLQPLTNEQIKDYLDQENLPLKVLLDTIKNDANLAEMARTPLMLSIMTLAYHGLSQEELKPLSSIKARRNHLFSAYVDRMFERRPLTQEISFGAAEAKKWLTNLSHSMLQQNQSIFFIERLQPTWTQTNSARLRYQFIIQLLISLFCGLVGGVTGSLILPLFYGFFFLMGNQMSLPENILATELILTILSSIAGLFLGMLIGLRVGLNKNIILSEELSWSPKEFLQTTRRELNNKGSILLILIMIAVVYFGSYFRLNVLFIMFIVIIVLNKHFKKLATKGLVAGLFVGMIIAPFGSWWGGALIGFLVSGMIAGLSISIQLNQTSRRTNPNQGIRNSLKNALRMSLFYGFIGGLLGGLIGGLSVGWIFGSVLKNVIGLSFGFFGGGLIAGLTFGVLMGLSIGLILGLVLGLFFYGGIAILQHYTLRWVLAWHHILPFPFHDQKLVTYLDAMNDLIFLKRIGGGWVFIHRSLMEYFASLHPDFQGGLPEKDKL